MSNGELDRLQDMIDDLVKRLNKKQARQWLLCVKQQKDPRGLPYYNEYSELFYQDRNVFGKPALIMHFMVLTSFVALAEIKAYSPIDE